MTLQIQETKICGKNIEILIADAPSQEQAKEWIRFSIPITGHQKESLGAWRVTALQRLRDIIGVEILKITSARDHLP